MFKCLFSVQLCSNKYKVTYTHVWGLADSKMNKVQRKNSRGKGTATYSYGCGRLMDRSYHSAPHLYSFCLVS